MIWMLSSDLYGIGDDHQTDKSTWTSTKQDATVLGFIGLRNQGAWPRSPPKYLNKLLQLAHFSL